MRLTDYTGTHTIESDSGEYTDVENVKTRQCVIQINQCAFMV